MQVGDLVRPVRPFYSSPKLGIIIKRCGGRLNDLWLVHWYDGNPFDEQCYDYDLEVIG